MATKKAYLRIAKAFRQSAQHIATTYGKTDTGDLGTLDGVVTTGIALITATASILESPHMHEETNVKKLN